MKPRLSITAIAGMLLWLGATGPGHAHNPLSHPAWCENGGQLTVVAEVEWSGLQILQSDQEPFRAGAVCDGAPLPADVIPPTCSLFDDDWQRVHDKIQTYCQQFAVSHADPVHPDHGSMIYIPLGPAAYTAEDHHHALYQRDLGLVAACVRCDPLPVGRPVRPAPVPGPVE